MYKFCSEAYAYLKDFDISDEKLKQYILYHILDVLPYHKHVTLLNYLYDSETTIVNQIEERIKQYYDNKLLEVDDIIGIYIPNKGENTELILENNKWITANSEDKKDLEKIIIKKIKYIISKTYNLHVGLIVAWKKSEEMVFKVKNMKNRWRRSSL